MLEKILESCKYVVDNANDVKIDYSKADELAEKLLKQHNVYWLQTSPFGILDLDIKDLFAFLLIFQAIDFSYWGTPKWTVETENGELDGYYAMLYSLMKEVKRNPDFLNPDYLKKLSKEEFRRILHGNIEIPLFEERYIIITNIGESIAKNMNGNFYNFVKDITSDTKLLEIITSNFSNFNDISIYNGQNVYFYKLAQLLVSDLLHARKIKENIHVDYSHLVGCADYKIPQVMRNLGILEYSDKLASLVDNKKELLKDSNYEIEIRASMLIVINYIYKKINRTICSQEINDYIWLEGQNRPKKIMPYHLTRTIFY